MTDASNTEWVIVIVLFGFLLVSSFVLGRPRNASVSRG